MGTHNYRLQVTGKKEGRFRSALPFTMYGDSYTNSTTETAQALTSLVYIRDVGCRERVVDFVRDFGWFFSGRIPNSIMGIRCFGEMYTKNALIIKEVEKGERTLAKFYSDVLGIKVEIVVDKIDGRKLNTMFLGRKSHEFKKNGKMIVREYNHTITVYLRSKNFSDPSVIDARISALLGLLRESRLTVGILEGTIKTADDVVMELLRISLARKRKEDYSYDALVYSFVNVRVGEYKDLMASVLTSLAVNSGNTDGSDWLSILWLANSIWLLNHRTFDDDVTGASGPASWARSVLSQKDAKEMKKSLPDKEVMKALGKEVADTGTALPGTAAWYVSRW